MKGIALRLSGLSSVIRHTTDLASNFKELASFSGTKADLRELLWDAVWTKVCSLRDGEITAVDVERGTKWADLFKDAQLLAMNNKRRVSSIPLGVSDGGDGDGGDEAPSARGRLSIVSRHLCVSSRPCPGTHGWYMEHAHWLVHGHCMCLGVM